MELFFWLLSSYPTRPNHPAVLALALMFWLLLWTRPPEKAAYFLSVYEAKLLPICDCSSLCDCKYTSILFIMSNRDFSNCAVSCRASLELLSSTKLLFSGICFWGGLELGLIARCYRICLIFLSLDITCVPRVSWFDLLNTLDIILLALMPDSSRI